MTAKLTKLFNNLPLIPRTRNHIFSGSNTWKEWKMIFHQWLTGKAHNDETIVKRYEEQFAEKIGTKFAYSFGAGRMSLYAILDALDIGPGDEVILPAYTCVVVPNAILYRGAMPIYVDIDIHSFNIDPALIEASITQNTKAVLAQHTFGFACNLEAIKAIANKYGLVVIEDCAHAMGATYKGSRVGSIGDIGFFSTDHSKVTSTFLGGMVTTNDPKLAEKVRVVQANSEFLPKSLNNRLLRSFLLEFPLCASANYWWGKFVLALAARLGLLFVWRDEQLVDKPTQYPYPARLSSQQALLGMSQLTSLESNLEHRRQACLKIDDVLHAGPRLFEQSACLRYSFLVENRGDFETRFEFLWELGTWFTSVAQGRNDELEKIKYKKGSCPVAELAATNMVNFPTHQRTSHKFIVSQVSKHADWIKGNLIKSRNIRGKTT